MGGRGWKKLPDVDKNCGRICKLSLLKGCECQV